MKKEKKKKFKQQDEFGISDYELYSYAVSRYKEATGDKSLSITGIIVYLEKEIRYYRKKIMSYDKYIEESLQRIQVPRGQCKGFAGLKCRYEFAEIKVDEDDR